MRFFSSILSYFIAYRLEFTLCKSCLSVSLLKMCWNVGHKVPILTLLRWISLSCQWKFARTRAKNLKMFLGSEPFSSKVGHIYLKPVFERITCICHFQTGTKFLGLTLFLLSVGSLRFYVPVAGMIILDFLKLRTKLSKSLL